MPDNNYPLWSTLQRPQRVEALMKIITEAATNKGFRAKCIAKETRKETMEGKAEVTFDDGMELKCYPDDKAASNELVLKLPDLALPDGAVIGDYWICTYDDYEE